MTVLEEFCQCRQCLYGGDIYTGPRMFMGDRYSINDFTKDNIPECGLLLDWTAKPEGHLQIDTEENLESMVTTLLKRFHKETVEDVCQDVEVALRFGRVLAAKLATQVVDKRLPPNLTYRQPVYIKGFHCSFLILPHEKDGYNKLGVILSGTPDPYCSVLWLVCRLMKLDKVPWVTIRTVLNECNYTLFVLTRLLCELCLGHWRHQLSNQTWESSVVQDSDEEERIRRENSIETLPLQSDDEQTELNESTETVLVGDGGIEDEEEIGNVSVEM